MYVRRPCLLSALPLFNLFIVSFFHTQSMLLGEIFIVMTASDKFGGNVSVSPVLSDFKSCFS